MYILAYSVKPASVCSTPVVVASTGSVSVEKINKLTQTDEKSANELNVEKTPGHVRSPVKKAKVVLKNESVKKQATASTATVFDPLAKPSFVFGNSEADLHGGPKNDVFSFKNKDKKPRKIEPLRSNKLQHKAAAMDKIVRKPKLVRPVKKVANDGVPGYMRATISSRVRRRS